MASPRNKCGVQLTVMTVEKYEIQLAGLLVHEASKAFFSCGSQIQRHPTTPCQPYEATAWMIFSRRCSWLT